jgi:hypothetical protein
LHPENSAMFSSREPLTRHCEPTDPREVARSDDRLREAIQQEQSGLLRRHSPSETGVNALLPRNDELGLLLSAR